MFNNNMQGISVLSYSILNSVAEVITENTFEKMESDNYQFASSEGDLYLPLETELDYVNDRGRKEMPTFFKEGINTEIQMMSYNDFVDNYISGNITTIAYNKSIFLPTLLRQLAEGDKTYGCIIQLDDYMLNPLHPLVAFSIMSNLLEIPDEANLHIFEWSGFSMDKINQISTSDNNANHKFYEKEYGKIFDLMSFLIKKPSIQKQTAKVQDRDIENILRSPLLEDINARINININTSDGGGATPNNIKSIIVPTQLAIGNIATPYYGLLWLDNPQESAPTGYNVGPAMSGNLNMPFGDPIYQSLVSNASPGNVCCGSRSANTHRGWSTLSKVNINSMFDRHIIDSKSILPFVEASKRISAAIWSGIEKKELEALEEMDERE